MPLEHFATSESLTLGVELELQLVSLSDFDLIDASPDMLELLARRRFPGNVVPEITESMIEVSTDVQRNHTGLLGQLHQIRDALVAAGDTLNVGVCGGGTHPFQQWSERKIFSKPRFKEVSALYGYLAKQFTIFGQHVHVGCTSGDQAMFLLHALNRYVPHFIALSASSPYVQRHDTLFNSARLNSVFAFPLSGRAPFMLRWSDFEQRLLRPDGAHRRGQEHEGLLLGHPAQARVRHDRAARVRHARSRWIARRHWPVTCRRCVATCSMAASRRRPKATTWSTTTTGSRPAASAWTAPSCTPRPTRRCRCAKTS